MRTEEIRKG